MIVNDMRGWMSEFAFGITAIPVEDSQERVRVAEIYRQSALSFSKEMSDSVTGIEDDLSNVGAIWEREPLVLGLDSEVSTDGALWVAPDDPVDIADDSTPRTECSSMWPTPKDPINIGSSGGMHGVSKRETWAKPKDALDIDVSDDHIYAIWADPSIWGY